MQCTYILTIISYRKVQKGMDIWCLSSVKGEYNRPNIRKFCWRWRGLARKSIRERTFRIGVCYMQTPERNLFEMNCVSNHDTFYFKVRVFLFVAEAYSKNSLSTKLSRPNRKFSRKSLMFKALRNSIFLIKVFRVNPQHSKIVQDKIFHDLDPLSSHFSLLLNHIYI